MLRSFELKSVGEQRRRAVWRSENQDEPACESRQCTGNMRKHGNY